MDLIHGDCLVEMQTIDDNSIDMILCDLPYGTTACKWDTIIPFDKLWKQYKRIVKPNGAIVLTASQPFSSVMIASHIKGYKHTWYWIKEKGTNFATAKYCPMRLVEEINVFTANGEKVNYYPILEKLDKPYRHVYRIKSNNDASHMSSSGMNDYGTRVYKTYTHKQPNNVLYFNRPNQNRGCKGHPTQKPVALMEYLINTYTNEGETVLDNCMGSGTTGVACANINRNFIGMEMDANYFEVAKKRIENAYLMAASSSQSAVGKIKNGQ